MALVFLMVGAGTGAAARCNRRRRRVTAAVRLAPEEGSTAGAAQASVEEAEEPGGRVKPRTAPWHLGKKGHQRLKEEAMEEEDHGGGRGVEMVSRPAVEDVDALD